MSIQLLFKYAKPFKKQYFVVVVLLVMVDAIQLFIPLVIRNTIEKIQSHSPFKEIFHYGLIIIFIGVLMFIFRVLFRRLLSVIAHQLTANLRAKIFNRLLFLSHDFYSVWNTGDIMTRSSSDLGPVRRLFSLGAVSIIDTLFLGSAALGFMLILDCNLTLIAAIPFPLLPLITYLLDTRIHHAYNKVQQTFSELTAFVHEQISGIFVLKAFGLENKQTGLLSKISKNYTKENIKATALSALFDPLMGMVVVLSNALVLYFGGLKVIHGSLSLGALVAFIAYLDTLVWPVMAMGFSVSIYQRGIASLKRIEEICNAPLDKRSSQEQKNNNIVLDKPLSISINKLCFAYPAAEILSNVVDDA